MLKSYFKGASIFGAAGLCYFSFGFPAQAITFTHYPDATSACYYNLPELAPLSTPRTLVVDSHLPNGAELYHWGYSEFVPNINAYCQSSGALINLISPVDLYFLPATGMTPDSNGVYPTSVSGIGIKFYHTYTSRGTSVYSNPYATTNLLSGTGSWLAPTEPLNIEYSSIFSQIGSRFIPDRNNTFNYYLSQQAHSATYSIRAVLVKTGNVTYSSTPLSMPRIATVQIASGGNQQVPNVIGGGGITIVPPACRLKTPTDYNINMGRWVHSGPGTRQPSVSLPANGPIVPVEINLECSGQVNNNVLFRFEDLGASPLANGNISLYDSGGTKIEGLEVAMFYGSNKINADNTSQVAIGAWGDINTNPQDTSFKPVHCSLYCLLHSASAHSKKWRQLYRAGNGEGEYVCDLLLTIVLKAVNLRLEISGVQIGYRIFSNETAILKPYRGRR